jgi:HAD superfamily hydrolase (TIGR01509 family)
MKKFRLVLFDLGNVLVRYTPEVFWQSLGLEDAKERSRYEPRVRDLTIRFESGECSTDEYFESLATVFENQYNKGKLIKAFKSVLTDPIPGMEQLVRKVVDANPAALVSNTNDCHFPDVLPRIPALKYLPKRYLSYQVGVIKPLPAFYERVIQSEGAKPDEMLFIDDVQENVKGAERAGMK